MFYREGVKICVFFITSISIVSAIGPLFSKEKFPKIGYAPGINRVANCK